jgi:hypothetical protein
MILPTLREKFQRNQIVEHLSILLSGGMCGVSFGLRNCVFCELVFVSIFTSVKIGNMKLICSQFIRNVM